jgi:multidrug efflux pump subunit AcrA (membrane-fusion protein)
MVRRKNPDRPLTREAAARWLSIAVCDLPDRLWTAGDVADEQQARPDWLKDARRRRVAAKAEQDRQRRARLAAVEAHRAGFAYPVVSGEAAEFAREFTRASLLNHLRRALDAVAADTCVVDSGYDVSVHASRAAETNRERAKRGVSLSGRDDRALAEHGLYREPGTLGDLFGAPTGNTRATYLPGAGLDAETRDDAWRDRWCLEALGLAYVVAGLALSGDIAALEVIAGVPLADVAVEPVPFGGITAAVLSLAREALHSWIERECPVLDPEEIVDMTAPVSALPRLLLGTRRDWTRTEQLAAVLAGVADG